MGWYIYFGIVLVASLVLGWHLGRFRAACTEMTGMMAGMTIGMLGGFALGYGMAAAAGRDLFLGNLVGVLLGALLGGWFGRAGDLMGIMDGAMGGVMGGSMGAMIAAMVYPDWKLQWTGVLFGGVYVVGALALTVLIESRTPDHGHLHWLLPKLTLVRSTRRVRVSASGSRSGRTPTATKTAVARPKAAQVAPASLKSGRPSPSTTSAIESVLVARPIRDYYSILKVEKSASLEDIEEAYLDLLATADQEMVERADRALITLRDPDRRARYDAALEESRKRQSPAVPSVAPAVVASAKASSERGECCPPPKKKAQTEPVQAAQATAASRQPVRPVGVGAAIPSVSASAATSAAAPVSIAMTSKPAELPVKKQAPTAPAAQATPARQAGQLPSLRSANATLGTNQANSGHGGGSGGGNGGGNAGRHNATANNGHGNSSSNSTSNSNSNGHVNPGKQQSGKQSAQYAAQRGAHPSAYQSQGRSGKAGRAPNGAHESGRRQPRGRGYAEREGMGRRILIGAGMGAAAMLLVFWIAFSAASGASGSPISQNSYSNPTGAIYHAPGPVPNEAQLDGQAVVATVGADGVQTANLVLDEGTSSYSPAAIKVKRGVPVRLNLSSTNGGRDCRSVVDITALGARGYIDSGQPSTLDFTPSQAGVYEINCPMRMVNPSYIVVTN